MPFHFNNVCANAPQYYVMGKLPIFFKSAPAIFSHLCSSLRISPIQRPLVGLSYNKLQDRQCKYNVTLMPFCEMTVAVEKQ
jgi:hypothetical protein